MQEKDPFTSNLSPEAQAAFERKIVLFRAYQRGLAKRRDDEADAHLKMFFKDAVITEQEKETYKAGYTVAMVHCLEFFREHFVLTPKGLQPQPKPPQVN